MDFCLINLSPLKGLCHGRVKFIILSFTKYLLSNLLSNVCKEINPIDLNDKTIASLQPNVSPGRYNLKFQANETKGLFTWFRNDFHSGTSSFCIYMTESTGSTKGIFTCAVFARDQNKMAHVSRKHVFAPINGRICNFNEYFDHRAASLG